MKRGSENGKVITIAVIGAGDWARSFHLPALKYLESRVPLRLGGIWDRTRETAAAAAEEFGIERVYENLDEVVDDDSLDCYTVLVNPAAIPEIVKRLAARGLPLLCEKTPGLTYEEAVQLAEAITATNVVAFNRRYMPINRRYKALVDGMESRVLRGVPLLSKQSALSRFCDVNRGSRYQLYGVPLRAYREGRDGEMEESVGRFLYLDLRARF